MAQPIPVINSFSLSVHLIIIVMGWIVSFVKVIASLIILLVIFIKRKILKGLKIIKLSKLYKIMVKLRFNTGRKSVIGVR